MEKRMLNEVTEEEFLHAIFQKSFSKAPLTIDEVKKLGGIDMGNLIIEYDMSYPQAVEIIYWLKNETQRITNEYLYQRKGDWDPRGVRPGSPGLITFESRKIDSSQLRKMIAEELKKC